MNNEPITTYPQMVSGPAWATEVNLQHYNDSFYFLPGAKAKTIKLGESSSSLGGRPNYSWKN